MREFHERRQLKRFLHSRYAIGLLIILCGFLLNAAWGVYGKYQQSKVIVERAEIELASLEERRAFLAASLVDLETDLGKEREIRDRFGAVKEGERMIVLVDESPKAASALESGRRTLWQRFIGIFTRD